MGTRETSTSSGELEIFEVDVIQDLNYSTENKRWILSAFPNGVNDPYFNASRNPKKPSSKEIKLRT